MTKKLRRFKQPSGRSAKKLSSGRFLVGFLVVVPVLLSLSSLNLLSSLTQYSDRRTDLLSGFTGWDDCAVVVMLSKIEERDLRTWHREIHQRQQKSLFPSRVVLRFAVPLSSSPAADGQLRTESGIYNDIFELNKMNITNEDGFPTSSTFDVMRKAKVLLDDFQCKSKYFVRAETSYVIHYGNLARAVERLPTYSVYFGSIVSRFPTPLLETRVAGGFSHSHLPIHAYGGVYGVSSDVLQDLIMPATERTVVRKDIAYEVPWQDRAIGLAIVRSQQLVGHIFYLKGIYHMCSPISLPCHKYKDFIAFKVSPEYDVLEGQKMKLLTRISDHLGSCKQKGEAVETILERIPQQTRSVDSTIWPVEECEELAAEGEKYALNVKNLAPIAAEQISEDTSCAEQLYLLENPEAVELIRNGTFKSGRHHYVDEGWKDGGKSYFCPDYCQGRDVADCIKDCDKEKFYLEHYPDIKGVVDAGMFPSGRAHYEMHGIAEQRAWSCLRAYQPVARGSLDGCLQVWKKFINSTYPVVKTWPLWGLPNDVPEEKCKSVMLIDGKGGPWIEYMFRIFRRFVGPDWRFYLIGPPSLTKDWRKKFEGPMFEVLDIPQQFGNLSDYPRQVNELYLSKWLWDEAIKCEYVVHTHADVIMFRPGIDDFLNYAYVGAPVSPETYILKEWSRICINRVRCGGGGGFSMRRKSFTLKALQHCRVDWTKNHCEDMWYSECMGWMGDGGLLAHPTESNRMSLGDKCEVDNPVGMHHAWMFCKTSTCAYAIADSKLYRDIYGDNYAPKGPCPEGEHVYFHKYGDVAESSEVDFPAWDHFIKVGRKEGRFYPCFDPVSPE